MLEQLASYLRYGTTFCGIEDGALSQEKCINAVLATRDKKGIDVKETFRCGSIAELSEQLPKRQHAWLAINNDKVITKRVAPKLEHAKQAIQRVFPSVRIDDFYYEILEGEDHQLVCLIRKEHADALIAQYEDEGIRMIGFSLGGLALHTIAANLNSVVIQSASNSYTIENGELATIQQLGGKVSTHQLSSDLKVDGDLLLPFASTIHYFRRASTQHNLDSKVEYLGRSYIEKRFFEQFSRVGILLLLAIFLLNFLFFSSYNKQVQTLAQTAQVNTDNKARLLELNTEVERKQKMATDLQSASASKSSYYLNQVARIVPRSLSLSLLEYQPISKRVKSEEPIALEENILLIQGSHTDVAEYHEWFSKLEELPMTQHVEIRAYGQGKGKSVDFELKLSLADD